MKGLVLTMFQMETTEPAETNTKVYYKHVSGYVIATITTYNTVDRQTARCTDVYWAGAPLWSESPIYVATQMVCYDSHNHSQYGSCCSKLVVVCARACAISIRLSSTNGPNKDDNGVVFADKHSTKYFTVNCLSVLQEKFSLKSRWYFSRSIFVTL